jgi:hypothetical protein
MMVIVKKKITLVIFLLFFFFKEIYGKLGKRFYYKNFMVNLVHLFSQYIKTCEIDFLIEIKNILFYNSIHTIPFSMINDLKIIWLKTVEFN